jgi:hypothetical protein
MRCPSCDVENADDAAQCSGCGKSFSRRPRRRGGSDETAAAGNANAERCNRAAAFAYRTCLLALIPGLGLALGPLGLLLGASAQLRGRRVRGFSESGLAVASVLLGAAITATQWAGVTMMIIGWHAAP